MKRITALLLALATVLSLSICAGADFTDAEEIDSKYEYAVNQMVAIGVINGMDDSSFQPQGGLTRAQAAKIICTMLVGADKVDSITAKSAGFTDVAENHWAAKYIDYCAEKAIVAGVGNSRFDPNGELTGAAWAKMLLAAYGHPAEELTGSKWFSNTQKAIKEKKLTYNAFTSDSPTTREKACQLAYNFYFEYNVMKDFTREETTISFADGKNMRLLGRAQATADGVTTHFSADGVEFELECGGQFILNYNAEISRYYQVIVDGEPVFDRGITGTGKGSVSVAPYVAPGKHTIRIIQESELDTSGKTCTITGITVRAKADTMKATANKDLFIEFIGDSITCGNGVLNYNSLMTNDGRSAWRAYSYMAAQMLDADYSMVAKGSIAATKQLEGHSIHDVFTAWNVYKDESKPFTYTRTPDVVVINIGTNDVENDPDEPFITEMKRLIQLVRDQHGSSPKIVLLYNIMKKQHGPALTAIAEELGGAAKGYYTLEMQTLTGGGFSAAGRVGHPSYEDNKVNAPILAEFIKSILK